MNDSLTGHSPSPARSEPLQNFWTFVTDFGDSALTLPLAALTLIFLLASTWRRAAFAYLLAVGSAGLGIGFLKLLLASCGKPLAGLQLTDPSGHAAMSAAIYGALALAIGRALPVRFRLWPIIAATLLVAGIALSRVLLQAHSPAEVAAGLIVGALSILLFRKVLGPGQAPALRLAWFALGAIAVAIAMHGTRWPIEQWIEDIGHLIRNRWAGCG